MFGASLVIGADDADIRYATRLSIPDPFAYVRIGEKEFALVSQLEYGRAKREAKEGIKVVSWESIKLDTIRKPAGRPGVAEYAAAFLKAAGMGEVFVPPQTAIAHVEVLQDNGIRPRVRRPFFPERAIKTPEELAAIKRAGLVTKKAYAHAMEMLRAAKIEWNDTLVLDGKVLTSEYLRSEIERVLLENGCSSGETIVSSGEQTAEPHNRGTGQLKAGVPIILDIFPRDQRTGYHFDMTRTIVKGTPSKEVKRMYATVRKAQAEALAVVAPGSAKQIHLAAKETIAAAGYATTQDEGFIHSTGHGLGLDIHESPAISERSDDILEPGMVITIEPGIYSKEHGGIRIEDTVLVTKNGCQNLTNVPKTLVVK